MATIKGHTGLVSLYISSAYKPIACITSTSMNRVAEMREKVNYCTQGETISAVDRINTTVSIDGEFVDDQDKTSYLELVTAMESKAEQFFKIEGRGDAQYFKAVISDLSDTFPGGEDATFSVTLNVNGAVSSTDPKE